MKAITPFVFVIGCLISTTGQSRVEDTALGEWPAYAGDYASSKYSPLDQINKQNVSNLEIAWIWNSIDEDILESGARVWHGSFEATPLMVGGMLYIVTPLNQVAALNPETGDLIWKYDPESYKNVRTPSNKGFIHRGLAFWTNGDDARIIHATCDAYLIALNAKTGKPVESFGVNGRVDLTKGLRKPVSRDGSYAVNSPAVVCRDVIVVGSAVSDGPLRKEGIPGDIRGFDVRTGETLWTFHTVAQEGEVGADTWEEGSNEYTGSANVWAPMSADEELGYVYLPVTAPTSDYYGGHRLGDNLFTQSIVCLDAKTGTRVWHYQTVHHDLWDYDLPCAPNLVDINVDGKPIKALAQLTKQAFTFVLDRRTGEPVWPIEERPVPQSTVPGEKTSPTQPFPTKPAPFDRQGMSEDMLIDLTPEIKAEAKKILEQYEYGPLYTPPSEKGTIVLPGYGGGANWPGGAFDPQTGILYVPSLTMAVRLKLGKPDPTRSNLRYSLADSIEIDGPFGLPLVKPPMSRITAINLNTGEHVWMKPHGSPFRRGEDDEAFPFALGELEKQADGRLVGNAIFSPGLVTKTLLFFGVGRPSDRPGLGEPMFQAFDKQNGDLIWEIELPSNTTGGPMTYMAGGKQYIVVAIGGGRRERPARLVAMTLP